MTVTIGDLVIDTLTGERCKILDIFTRDSVTLIEVTFGGGITTTATPDWFRAIEK